MLNKALISILIGTGISALAFVPFLIWQYRRYGAPRPGRIIWMGISFIYVSALISYTLFPLPDTSGNFCANRKRLLVIDPTEYFRDMYHHLQGLSYTQMLLSWDVMQMVLNIALFIPLGVILSDYFLLKFKPALAIGFATSLLIETTQYTANFGLTACQYRVADVNDLITNTLGTALGFAIALLIPRFVEKPDLLVAGRMRPRPVTRSRRLFGMFLDYFFLTFSASLGSLGTVLIMALLNSSDQRIIASDLEPWPSIGAIILVLLAILIPALTGSGASLGQRIVWLSPNSATRTKLVIRAFIIPGFFVLSLWFENWTHSIFNTLVFIDLIWVLINPRGLSFSLLKLDLQDSRQHEAG